MVKIKICGITNKRDAIAAASLRPDMMGFVFYNGSKRYVEPRIVIDIANELPDNILKVGVFVNEKREKISEIAQDCSLDTLQFHGEESPEYCAAFSATKIGGSAFGGKGSYKTIKAFRIKDKNSLKGINDYDVDFYMLDAYSEKLKGGTGESFDWKIIESFEFLKPVILSGGLMPDNVRDAIEKLSPYGVDVSSGVEMSPGKKDIGLMKKFVENVRRA
ncbi:MAG: phosphoribosylanthranilate isomerase [Candidatus Omnitrophica bacterium]|nr:phosphoribosylanthranilate isomerase [Candidatus Omnitrophota bacterium]